MAKPGRGSDQFPLRLPPGMRDKIKLAADVNGRSMNTEILDVLRGYYPEEPDLVEVIDEVEHTLALLKEVYSRGSQDDTERSRKLVNIIDNLSFTNEFLVKAAAKTEHSRIVKLDPVIYSEIMEISTKWDISSASPLDGLVNGLLKMSIDRISRGEENPRVRVEYGDNFHMVEILPPAGGSET